MADRVEFIISARDKYSKTMGSLTKMLPSLKTAAIATGAAIAGLGTALFALTKNTATTFDAIQKFSDQLGLSTEFLSKMQHAAELSGVPINNMNKALQMLQVRIGEANRGIGQGKDAFDQLGLSLFDANGQLYNAETVLPRLADAFRGMTSETERAEAASKIFGQRGIAMLQLFKDGRSGLKRMTDEAERFGLVVSGEAGRAAADFNDSFTRLKASLKGIQFALGKELMPLITRYAEQLSAWIADNRELLAQDVTGWLRDVAAMARAVGNSLKFIDDNLTDPVIDFLFGESKISKMQIYQQQLEVLERRHKDMMRSISAGVPVNKELIKTVYDKILITKQEIAALQEAKAAQDELSASTLKHHEILSIPTPSEITGGIHPLTQANLEVAKQVRQNFEDMYTGSQNMLYDLGLMEFETFAEDLEKLQSTKLQSISALSQQTATLVGAFGKKAFALQKGVGIANATVSAYEAYNKNLAAFPFPFGPIMAGIALATGLAQVAKIVALQPGGIAHGGLTNVPRESTWVLNKDERVLSPEQNKDFTEFLKSGGGGLTLNGDIIVYAEQPLDQVDWPELAEDKILPAMRDLAKAGIKI